MSKIDTGKGKVEQLIYGMAQALLPACSITSLVWWSIAQPDSTLDSPHGPPNVPLRIYRGNNWRLMEFLRSDIEDCGGAPEVLKKYEAEISEILMELCG
jgi:hypothetical protein